MKNNTFGTFALGLSWLASFALLLSACTTTFTPEQVALKATHSTLDLIDHGKAEYALSLEQQREDAKSVCETNKVAGDALLLQVEQKEAQFKDVDRKFRLAYTTAVKLRKASLEATGNGSNNAPTVEDLSSFYSDLKAATTNILSLVHK
jgi:hypothetical protein